MPWQVEMLKGLAIPWCIDCNRDALMQAVAAVGAVIMPHNLYLHSALVKTRKIDRGDPAAVKQANKYFFIEVIEGLTKSCNNLRLLRGGVAYILEGSPVQYSNTSVKTAVPAVLDDTTQKILTEFFCQGGHCHIRQLRDQHSGNLGVCKRFVRDHLRPGVQQLRGGGIGLRRCVLPTRPVRTER